MKTISLLQLGDMHLPDHRDAVVGDLKDSGAPPSMLAAISQNRLRAAVQKVDDVIRTFPISALLICGDLTSRGVLSEYDECVDYLNNALSIEGADPLKHTSIHVVPGNHDVNRDLCDPKETDVFSKFDPLVDSWNRYATDILAAKAIRATEVAHQNASLHLFSLNSCIGCGERRHIPSKLRARITAAIAAYTSSAPSDDAFDLIYEELDTPALVDTHVDSLVSSIGDLPPSALPVVLAHHNVLPQAVTRVEIYTELINSGRLRDRLASCKRPLVYCHGHIHTDPIESIKDYSYPGSSILCVSAPEAINGFNVLSFQFARNNNLPLGCEITKFRAMHGYGTIEQRDTVRVSFVTPDQIGQFDDDVMKALLTLLTPVHTRFKKLREDINQRLNRQLQNTTIHDVVLEAEWLSLVSIDDRNLPHEHWRIRRVEP